MGRRDQQQSQPTPEDPLADLRNDPVPGNTPAIPGIDPMDADANGLSEEPEAVTIRPMVDQQTQDDMVAEVVAAWHRDPTSQGFLHGGAACGCRYMAQLALQVAVPVMTEQEDSDQELEASHG